jgi:hypothetical protein
MPIGAVIGAGVLTAGASIYTGSKAASAQKSAANNASDTTLQVASENNQLARDMYAENASRLDPYSNMGLAAGDEFMGLLLGHAPTTANAGNGWAPVKGVNTPAATPTPTTGGTGSTPVTGYGGPALGAISSQAQMDAYMAYYHAHPEQDPGFTNITQFHGDPYKDEDAASAVLAARNAYLAAHPPVVAPAPVTTPAPVAAPPVAPKPPVGVLAPFAAQGTGTSALAPMADPAQVAAQAHQAIAAGADPNAVAQRASQYGVRLQ